jgi:hypothetical protein
VFWFKHNYSNLLTPVYEIGKMKATGKMG